MRPGQLRPVRARRALGVRFVSFFFKLKNEKGAVLDIVISPHFFPATRVLCVLPMLFRLSLGHRQIFCHILAFPTTP